jgi:hypothetical protein
MVLISNSLSLFFVKSAKDLEVNSFTIKVLTLLIVTVLFATIAFLSICNMPQINYHLLAKHIILYYLQEQKSDYY